jgi:hypothetical protein
MSNLLPRFAFFLSLLSSQIAFSQMIDVGTPMYGFGNSWYERQGVGFDSPCRVAIGVDQGWLVCYRMANSRPMANCSSRKGALAEAFHPLVAMTQMRLGDLASASGAGWWFSVGIRVWKRLQPHDYQHSTQPDGSKRRGRFHRLGPVDSVCHWLDSGRWKLRWTATAG